MSVVVVGLGPAGTIATWALARAEHRVTAIDAGTPGRQFRAPLPAAAPTLRSTVHEDAVHATGPQAGRDGIGGSKLLAAPQSFRLDPWTLRMRTRVEARHGAGVLPPGTDVRDWPLEPAELHEWYEPVERLLQVGQRPSAEWTRRMAVAARGLGLAPFAAPAAVSRDTGFLLEQAVDTGRVTTMLGTTVLNVLTDRSGLIGVRVHQDGRIHTVAAVAVVLAGSVLANVRILLMSGLGARQPDGTSCRTTSFVCVGASRMWTSIGDQQGPRRPLRSPNTTPTGSIAPGAVRWRFDSAGGDDRTGSVTRSRLGRCVGPTRAVASS